MKDEQPKGLLETVPSTFNDNQWLEQFRIGGWQAKFIDDLHEFLKGRRDENS
ncbi:hypothetical protein [Leuconostoc gasicomitatum]|uniref:hypothetical protein n=1 Tax=Leuconostoc gasicomitatum TaxID=115778 RepID=UPI001CC73C6A|nr:hypothetical protein [Leuconostoc gasicomitatum]MBZ5980059.1 hypothetical protein [Leuconostoc gasicomitatum]